MYLQMVIVFVHSALFLAGVRHSGCHGLLNRSDLRMKMADWLRNRKDNSDWQIAATSTGETGIAIDIAKAEAARASDAVGSTAATAGDIGCDEALVVARDGEYTCDQLTDLIEEEIPADFDGTTLQILMRYIGATTDWDAQRLARGLSKDELRNLVEKCEDNPDGMNAPIETHKRKATDTTTAVRRTLSASTASPLAKRWSCPVYLRLAIGESIIEWQQNAKHFGRGWVSPYFEYVTTASENVNVDEAKRHRGSDGQAHAPGRHLSMRERSFLYRCLRLAQTSTMSSGTVAKSFKKARTSMKLGRPPKAPTLRDNLFEWFCSVRGSVKGRLPLSALRYQAERLRALYIATAAKLLRPVRVPKITSRWLSQFRREKHISLRLPNKRWKIPRHVFMERNQIAWLNNIRVRYWILLATGQEPECIDNMDQKPFHVNEAGSKYQKTLAFKGGEVELIELHSATRESDGPQTLSGRVILSGP